MSSKVNLFNFSLSPNFNFAEFVVSREFQDVADKVQPTPKQINSIYLLANFALQPLREMFGQVIITSGLRSPELNMLVGGVDTSQHLTGEAADFSVSSADLSIVYDFILHDLSWKGQVRYYRQKGFIHIGMPNYFIPGTQTIVTEG